jgi:heme exporter protein CcmD
MMHAWLVWFHMGGYAHYIWPAYGAVVVVFGSLFLRAHHQKKHVWRLLRRLAESR